MYATIEKVQTSGIWEAPSQIDFQIMFEVDGSYLIASNWTRPFSDSATESFRHSSEVISRVMWQV